MSNERHPGMNAPSPMICTIRLRGHLSGQWADWFEGLVITPKDNGDTVLTGQVADSAALYGFLRKVRDLGMPLRSVICVESDQPEPSDIHM